jgi:hypothetical protein
LLCKCCTYGYAFSNFTTGASQRQEWYLSLPIIGY